MESVTHTVFDLEAGPDDAVFVTNGADVRHLQLVAKSGFERTKLFSLSLHAQGAAMRAGHPRILDFRSLIDFPACADDYHRTCPDLSQTWLRSMGLHCEIDGIDLAEFDAPAQFLFFLHVQHIARLVERIVVESPDVRRFYVLVSDPLVPLDFYFDSDVTAAIVRYVCDRLDRPVQAVTTSGRPAYIPAPRDDVSPESTQPEARLRKSRSRAGIVASTVRNTETYLSALRALSFDTVVFGSELWGMPPQEVIAGMGLDQPVVFSNQNGCVDRDIADKLSGLRRNIAQKIGASSLPACIRDNRYLDFQLDHIVMKRWLGYARLIRQAAAFVKKYPLDLLICSDHFTAEGAVLSHLYRREGTPIMTAPHSSWPVDINWRSPRHVDYALALSKSAARRLAQLDPRARIRLIGAPEDQQRLFRRIYPSGSDRNDALQAVREAVGDRKVVLLLTNALEVHTVPITDPVAYFDACSELTHIPAALRERVAVLVRPKPGAFGEDPILYKAFAGFPESSLVVLTSIGFDDCIQLSDCVVGVNIPTSGYWDVLRNNIPLIHMQASDALSLHPNLPDKVIGGGVQPGRLWDAIAPTLFDEAYRERFIERQRAFFDDEHQSGRSSEGGLLQSALLTARRRRFGSRLAGMFDRWRSLFHAPRCADQVVSLRVSELKLVPSGAVGHVDEVKISVDNRTVAVSGWAASLARAQPATRIHAFFDGLHCGTGRTGIDRSDVAAAYNEPRLSRSGFLIRFAAAPAFELSKLALYGELSDGMFFALAPERMTSTDPVMHEA